MGGPADLFCFYLLQIAGAVLYCRLNLERIEMKHFYIHIPSWIHRAMTQHGYDKKDAIKRFKRQYGFVRMPKGFGIWEAK